MLIGREAFTTDASGAGRSRITPAYLERLFGCRLTMRNWNTVTRLVEMTSQAG